ncbi:MAG: carboxypeptidase C (cathepsin A) [Verrucomicrobiales bacterium]|jgi:carboxypeptidase C (cathepsin A)
MSRILTLLVIAFTLGAVSAQDEPEKKPAEQPEKEEDKKKAPDRPEPVSKLESVEIGGKKVDYEVTAGTIGLPDRENPDKKRAEVFFISYIVEQTDGAPERPISFCFNGGPGSSSVWLHLGAFGPRRVQLDETGTGETLAAPPYGLVDNEHSILDTTDLVFIDPVSTGFSRAEEQKKAGEFHGFDGDIESVGQFIHQYCSKHGRWNSPKYIMGESYGGLRAGGLAEHLQQRYGMYLNGIVLVSAVLDFSTILFSDDNDLPYELFLPSYAASAKFHGQSTAESPAAAHAKALSFIEKDYTSALRAGSALTDEKRAQIVKELAELTGLSEAEVDRADLRLNSSYFRKLLLRDEGHSVGRFDGRVVGIDAEKAPNYPDYDSSYSVVYGPFASAFNHYLRVEIGFESEDVYEVLSRNVHPWDYKRFTNRYVSVTSKLGEAMTLNPHLRVFAAAGYYDLATPPAAIEHSLAHLPIDRTLKDNIEVYYYDGGHMMYTNLKALAQLKEDLAGFLKTEKE